METEVKGWSVPTCSQEEPWGWEPGESLRAAGAQPLPLPLPQVPVAGSSARQPHPRFQLPTEPSDPFRPHIVSTSPRDCPGQAKA